MSLVETANHATHAYFDSAIMLLFFLLCGRSLDHAMRRKTRAVAGNLAALKAEFAHRFDRRRTRQVPVAALQAGRPAAGAAGRTRAGRRHACSAAHPRSTKAWSPARPRGAPVAAGAHDLCRQHEFLRRAHHAGDRGRRAARCSTRSSGCSTRRRSAKSRYVRLADRAARLYAPVVHATAALTAVGWLLAGASLHDAIVTAIAVLIITCPCALALAIPAVQVVASGALFRAGVHPQRRRRHRAAGRGRHVVFDKTGTLTLPEPRVVNAARSIRTCWSWRRGSRCRAAIRSRAAVAREARAARALTTARSRSRGRACAP